MSYRLTKNISRDTRVLILLAVVGLVVFVFVLPGQHPDSKADTRLSRSDAVAAATTFLVRHGYSTTDLEPRARLHRWSSVIESVQDSLGRSYLMQNIDAVEQEVLPLHSWEVIFYQPTSVGGWDGVFNLGLTLSGKVFEFSNNSIYLGRLDRVAIGTLFRNRRPVDRIVTDPDSLRPPSFDFDSGLFPTRLEYPSDTTALLFKRGVSEENAGELLISPEGTVAIARHHLEQYHLAGYFFAADSVWLATDADGTVANVRFVSTESQHGQIFTPVVSITTRGSLYSIEVRHDSPAAESDNTTTEIVALGISAAVAFIIFSFLIVSFFRRLISRLIDVKAALIDAFAFATMLVLWIVTISNLVFGFSPFPIWARLLFPLVIGGFVGGGMAVLLFLVTSSADSLARPHWSRQLLSASLMRQGRIMNVRVGQALIRGVLLGFVLLGLTTALLAIVPDIRLELGPDLASGASASPFLSAIGLHGFVGYAELGIVLVGVLAVVRRNTARTAWSIAAAVIVLASVQISFPAIRPMGLEWLVSGIMGLVIGIAFIRFDLATILTGYFSGSVLWMLKEAFLTSGSGTGFDFILAVLLLVSLIIIGSVGIIRGAPIERVRDYVPAYIRDLRQQERLQHELSIAQQVQESFLPREMPSISGLDVAARCLPAEEVGGDYFDFVSVSPDRLAIVIGDVSGKGIQAAFFMTLTKGFLRTLCRENHEPAEVLKRINALFWENAPRGTFISMIYGILDLREHTFTFARAGHNPIILRRGGSQPAIEFIQPQGLGIGLASSNVFDKNIKQEVIRLGEDDTLVLFTDGFSEAMNTERKLFGDKQLSDVILDCESTLARGVLDTVQEEVDKFVDGAERHDDMTMIVVRFAAPVEKLAMA
ncbi:MAG: SpoIIE family protein phosphatase [Rhodothermales bacterium]|nr:SpoIIE family protein phosphatase [Rhodothermales bacterium]